MKVLLDTNICIAFLNGEDEAVRDKLQTMTPSDVHLCSVVQAELLYGARKSARAAHNLRRLARFFELFASLDFDSRAAQEYGLIRAQLEAQGTPIGGNDLMIASIAVARDVTLVTRNLGEFSRVVGLDLLDWSE